MQIMKMQGKIICYLGESRYQCRGWVVKLIRPDYRSYKAPCYAMISYKLLVLAVFMVFFDVFRRTYRILINW